MITFLTSWASAVWMTLCEAGPYLLLGLAIAGSLQALVPREKILKHLGGNDFLSVLKAALAGIPVPLCSCAVIPTAIQIRRSGASKGATSAFLISTPETGVDSIGVTWALLDPLMTFARPLAALVTAVGTGSAVNWLVRRGWDGHAATEAQPEPAPAHEHGDDPLHAHDHVADEAKAGARETSASHRGFLATCRSALEYAFGALLDDLSGWLIAGFLLSGLILVLVPDDFFGGVLPIGWPTMLAMLVIGIPLYVCASATTPIAAALILKGLDPGAALVLLLAGPATNLATMAIVSRFLGKRVLAVYVLGIAGFSLLCGGLLDRIYSRIGPIRVRALQATGAEGVGIVALVGGALFLVLLASSAHRTRLLPLVGARLRAWCAPVGFDPLSRTARAAFAVAATVLYGSTAFTVVAPGETAFVLRLGALCAQRDEPGLAVHLPFPIDRVERLPTDEVRSATFGFEEGGPQPAASPGSLSSDRTAESEIVAGDETILRVTYAVHYRVSDARRFRFGVADPDMALRDAAESSARRMIGHRRSEEVLVESREAMQTEMLGFLREELAALDVGIEPVAVHLVYVHVPQRVHDAYLDVASALEDKEGSVRKGEKYRAERQADARARARATEEGALAKQSEVLEKAHGEATAFDAVSQAHRLQPDVDDERRMLAALASALGRSTLVLLLASGVDVRLVDGGSPASNAPDTAETAAAQRLLDSMEER